MKIIRKWSWYCKRNDFIRNTPFDTIEDQELCDDVLVNITYMSCVYHKKCVDMLRKEDLLYEKNEDSSASEKEGKKEKKKVKINKD